MITLSDSEPSSPTNSLKPEMEIEPDDAWKKILKSRIQSDLSSMAKEVRETQLAELRKSSYGPEDRKRFDEDFKAKMASMRESATDQYQIELEKERNKRRWAAGEPMLPGWSKYLEEEQQHALDSFKQSRDPPVSPTHLQATFRSLSRASRKSSTAFPTSVVERDIEPDEEWKKQLRARIQLGFQPKIQHAKDKHLLDSKKGQVSPEEKKRIEDDYKAAMENVKSLAADEYNFELDKERSKRRLALMNERPGAKLDELDIPWTAKSLVSEISESSLLAPPQKEPIMSRSSDLEPDDAWKDKLRSRIQTNLKGMVKSTNERHFLELKDAAEHIARLDAQYKAQMDEIKAMSNSRYEDELARERLRRRGFAQSDAVSDNEESDESEESEESDKDKDGEMPIDFDSFPPELKSLAATTREKQEHFRRVLDETHKREVEVEQRERDLLRRDKKLERRQSEARQKEEDDKLNDEEDDKPETGKAKLEEHVKWKDLDTDLEAEDPTTVTAAEKARRKEEAIADQFRGYDGGDDLFEDDFFAQPDPKWIEEQAYIWQQLQYQQQADAIRRKRQEQRARQDSMDSDKLSNASPSSSPVITKMPPQIPQFLPPPVNRNHVPVTPWAPAGFTLADAHKLPPSPSIPRKPSLLAFTAPMGIPKPRTSSVSSGSGSVTGNSSTIPHAPSPAPRNIQIVVPPNNLYARVAMTKRSATEPGPNILPPQ